MRRMKFLSLATFALASISMISCSSDDDTFNEPQQPNNKDNVITLTTTVSRSITAQTRALTADGVKTFAAGDRIAVVYKNTSGNMVKVLSNTLPDGDYGSSATFTVTLTNPQSKGSLKYIYPAAMANADGSINYDALATQDGTLASIAANLDLALYEGSLTSTAVLPDEVTMDNKLVVAKFTIKNGETDITNTVTSLKVGDGTNTYTVTPSSLSTIWVAMQPVSSDKIVYVGATAGGQGYGKAVTSKTLSEGYIYPVNISMIANTTLATLKSGGVGDRMGDYVKATGEVSKAPFDAIGRVAYKAYNGEYSEGIVEQNNPDYKILVLALTDVGSYSWKYTNGGGESDWNDPDALNGLAFCSTFCSKTHEDPLTHEVEWAYPAAHYACEWQTSRPGGASIWFFPSRKQLELMSDVALADGVGQFTEGSYWTATEAQPGSEPSARFYQVKSDHSQNAFKYSVKGNERKVRACFAY